MSTRRTVRPSKGADSSLESGDARLRIERVAIDHRAYNIRSGGDEGLRGGRCVTQGHEVRAQIEIFRYFASLACVSGAARFAVTLAVHPFFLRIRGEG